eukprot:scaffold171294_cov18-Tisochrysis_lutea.AAC.2
MQGRATSGGKRRIPGLRASPHSSICFWILGTDKKGAKDGHHSICSGGAMSQAPPPVLITCNSQAYDTEGNT